MRVTRVDYAFGHVSVDLSFRCIVVIHQGALRANVPASKSGAMRVIGDLHRLFTTGDAMRAATEIE